MATDDNKISPQMKELDTRQQLLVVTMEECGELIQACSKLLRRSELYSDGEYVKNLKDCLLYTSPSPRDGLLSRMPSSA